MTVLQSGQNVLVSYKVQSGLGTPASGAGGTGVRIVQGTPGMKLSKQYIPSNEARRDGQSTRGRGGNQQTSGDYESELSCGTSNDWLEAVIRTTTTAAAVIAAGAMTSITTTTSTIVAAAGSWLTQGVRIGDKIKLTASATGANNNIWFRVVNVTASTITVAGTPLTLNASADATFSLTVAKTMVSGATPTERYFTVDEYDQDLDLTTLFTDCKITKMVINAQPNQNIKVTFSLAGLAGVEQTTGASPVLTSPTFTTTLPLVMADGTIRVGGIDYSILTGFQLTYDLGGNTPGVLALNSPDVFLDNAKISGSFTALKQDLAFFAAFRAETQVDFFVDCVVAASVANPRDFVSFYVGNAILTDASGALGNQGPRVITMPWQGGKDEAGGARASTTLKVSTSV